MLDSRAPPGERYSYQEQEAQVEQNIEDETRRLMAETRLWRMASSAFWIAWGIVQAVVPGMPDFDAEDEDKGKGTPAGEEAVVLDSATKETRDEAAAEEKQGEKESVVTAGDVQVEEEEEFDYLGYTQERAMFFWGDAIKMGIVQAEELPEEIRGKVKMVEY